ncbi:FtsX-like permease family protein [Arthrobacter sp. R1-13]
MHATVAEGRSPAEVLEVAGRAEELPGIRSAVIGYAQTPLLGAASIPDLTIRAADAPKLGFEHIPGTGVFAFDFSFLYFWTTQPVPLSAAATDKVEGLHPVVMMIDTDGSPEAMDRARTVLNSPGITAMPAASVADSKLQTGTLIVQGLAVLAYLGMFVATAIAGISLAVATASAVLDRARVLGLMRLMGMPVSVIRRIIAREAAVPLLAVLLLSIGLGFLVAWLMVTSIDDTYKVTWPTADYFMALGLSLLLALGAVTATFGLIRTNTAVTATRFE